MLPNAAIPGRVMGRRDWEEEKAGQDYGIEGLAGRKGRGMGTGNMFLN